MSIFYDIDFGQQYGFGYLTRLYSIDPSGGNGVPTYTIVLPISRTHEHLDYSSGDIGLIIKTNE